MRTALPGFYDVASVAAALNVTERTVRRWLATGRLPNHKIGGGVRISEPDLKEFIRTSRR